MWSRFEAPRQRLPSLGSINLALLSLYFFLVWGRGAGRVLFSSYSSLGDHAHATTALYFAGLFDLSFKGMLLTSYALAGIKLVIAAACVSYLIEFARALVMRREPDHETVDVVLILAVAAIMLGLIPAMAFGDAALVRLHSTQMLLVAGAIVVVVVERHLSLKAEAAAAPDADAVTLPVGVLTSGTPPAPAAAALARIPEARLRVG
ncbi:MAG: hypothetical protein K2Y71_20535 [Xanthobacteraceae bacterium]|nr:hypothetical protein [Xanthobacteraceae bacterium]